MNNACVIGYGMVGRATALAFGIEKYFSRSKANITMEEASKCKYIFICLPTPLINGHLFTDDIYAMIKQILEYPRHVDNIFIIRSTVYPGFANHVQKTLGVENVVSNPEFLSEETWEKDAVKPALVVIGANNQKYLRDVVALYKGRYKYMEPIVTDNVTAEDIKLTMNCWFSVKVYFANGIFDHSQKSGSNYEKIKQALESHPWGMRNHMTIWYKGKRGIHGRCLPKDLAAFRNITDFDLLDTVVKGNMKFL